MMFVKKKDRGEKTLRNTSILETLANCNICDS